MRADIQKNIRFNFTVNVLDGAFFGFAFGFSSYVTVIPLFVASLTSSSILIGLVASLHMIGWQLPQLLTANRVARLRRYKPMALLMTVNERVPFFGLALVALSVPTLGRETALLLTFPLLIWQAMGAGLTGTPWQSMIAKIFPADIRGTFYGTQSAAANLTQSGSAVLAGIILAEVAAPNNFALCFLLTGLIMLVSLAFLGSAREPDAPPAQERSQSTREFWNTLVAILRRDHSFRMFIVVRMLAQIASVGTAFYTVYAVRYFGMDVTTAGVMTAILMIGQTISNPLFGWLGDRHSHRLMFALGVGLAAGSAALALFAPDLSWFYLVFALAGFSSAALWTTTMALTVEFGSEAERPYYIGLANTLAAPATILAPLVGGWLADSVSYQATFGMAALSGLATVILSLLMTEPRKQLADTFIPASPYVEQP